MNERILIIEDENKIARLLELELAHEGYATERADTGTNGLLRALEGQWDLILLDVMIPGLNGLEVLRRFRQQDDSTPVILLTARGATPDIVSGLDQGANDYITKPFRIEELLARIRACIRIAGHAAETALPAANGILAIGNLSLNPKTREVARDDAKIELTPKEYELLHYLMERRDEVCDREAIIQAVWGYDFVGDTNIVDVYIRYLRKKIDEPFTPKLIQTIRGVGYSLTEPESAEGGPHEAQE